MYISGNVLFRLKIVISASRSFTLFCTALGSFSSFFWASASIWGELSMPHTFTLAFASSRATLAVPTPISRALPYCRPNSL